MEAGQHEERRAVDPRRQLQVQLAVGMAVLVGLEAEERKAQHDGDEQPELERAAVTHFQGVVRDGQRTARGNQYDRVEKRDADRLHRREHFLQIRAIGRPSRRVIGPEQLLPEVAEIGDRDVAYVEQGAEERREEHHFGKDEPAHTPAEREVDLLVVEPVLGLAYHGAEPAEHHRQQHREAGEHQPRAHRIRVEPGRGAKRHQQQRARTGDRPVRWLRHVVVRLCARGRNAHRLLLVPA